MRRQYVLALGIALAAATGIDSAQAAKLPRALEGVPAFEVAEGRVSQGGHAPIYDQAPRVAQPHWFAFREAAQGSWRAMWNPETGVPQRIFGAGIQAPGAVQSASSAEAHARRALREHIELLAPGARESDFVLAANHLDATGMRTVSFFQHHQGLRVLGGQVNFRFRNDRLFVIGSEALPNVRVPRAHASVAAHAARERARAWVERDFVAGSVSEPTGPYILPIVRAPGQIEYHTVQAVRVSAPSVPALWDVYVDGITGEPVARRQRLAFASAHIRLDVPARHPLAERITLPASFLRLSVEGLERFTDVLGYFTWSSGRRDVSFTMRGPYVRVFNGSQAPDRFEHEFRDGDDEVFGAPEDEFFDAQVALFAHVNLVKEYVRTLTTNPWVDEQMVVNANLSDSLLPVEFCNAFYNPADDTINFLPEGTMVIDENAAGEPIEPAIEIECANTGRLADVIYHEFGHAIHTNAIIPGVGEFDGALSEGVSDYLAATITGDPGMGRGFFLRHTNNEALGPDSPMRHIDPESIGGERKVYPDDLNFIDGQEDIHGNGEIIGATLWHLRKELIAAHGEAEGIAQADRIWYGILQRATNMPTAYVEALAADDDDGDLENGTPNSCIINRAFGAGGLGDGSGVVVPGIEPPVRDGFNLSLPVTNPAGCEPVEIGTVRVHWRLRDDPGSGGTLVMEPNSGGYGLRLPAQEDERVMEYQVELVFQNGSTFTYPNNPADPYYRFFIGGTEEIYCTSFESDPFEEQDDDSHWLSEAEVGDDAWEWGAPQSRGLGGAPTSAYNGSYVLATDLGENSNGLYPPSSRSWVQSPPIDIYGLDDARLQFRRWLAVDSADRARIYINDQVVWESSHARSPDDEEEEGQGAPSHRDREWILEDIDLAPFLFDATIHVRFEIESDGDRELAGWAIDDFCVVSYVPDPGCPDFELGETCDGECPPGCFPPDDSAADGSGGCGCSAGAAAGPDAGTLLLGFGLLVALGFIRRRRVTA
jgi:MYXO-CTERM domain-containing protein